MDYICKNCGEYVTKKQFETYKDLKIQGLCWGCLIWAIILFCCVSIILLPIAIILILKEFRKTPGTVCPYCKAKDSLIPDNTPLGRKLIKENYTDEDLTQIQKIRKQQINEQIEDENLKNKNKGLGCGILVFFIILGILASIFS